MDQGRTDQRHTAHDGGTDTKPPVCILIETQDLSGEGHAQREQQQQDAHYPRQLTRKFVSAGQKYLHHVEDHDGDHRFAVCQDGTKRGRRGYDAGKKTKGRKRHIAGDTEGNLLAVIVYSAGIQDRVAGRDVLIRLFCRFETSPRFLSMANTPAS